MIKLHKVFTLSGIPTHTFVKRERYSQIVVSLETPGRSLIIEGPSGIGKTTSLKKLWKI